MKTINGKEILGVIEYDIADGSYVVKLGED